jgi:hypothetical protein
MFKLAGPFVGLSASLAMGFLSFLQLFKDHSGIDTHRIFLGLGAAAGGALVALEEAFHDAFGWFAAKLGMGTMPLEITAGIISVALALFFLSRLKE